MHPGMGLQEVHLPFCVPQKLTRTVTGAAVRTQERAGGDGKLSPVVCANIREIPGLLSVVLFTKNFLSARKVLVR